MTKVTLNHPTKEANHQYDCENITVRGTSAATIYTCPAAVQDQHRCAIWVTEFDGIKRETSFYFDH